MRFQLYIYRANGSTTMAVRDLQILSHRSGSVLIRDQSSYAEDGGRMVWKNAAYPASVLDAVRNGKGFVAAEADALQLLDANMNWSMINYLWENRNENA